MPRKPAAKTGSGSICAVCKETESKYRCSACPIRYCSVPCYKLHKVNAHPEPAVAPSPGNSDPREHSQPGSNGPEDTSPTTVMQDMQKPDSAPLRALTSLSWPPEPDESVFTDPLKRDDPKPLRREELLRIATSADLRQLLTSSSLPLILTHIDSLLTPSARSAMLSRCLSIDPISLSSATADHSHRDNILSQRNSPPPMQDLLKALAGAAGVGDAHEDTAMAAGDEKGFWLGRLGSAREGEKSGRIWIGEEEKRVMRIWAGVVCRAIDGDVGELGDVAWGQGGLEWDL